ncbi:MAG: flagellar hook capping FlgD N-terminal domain-containing protein [Ruminiclostridium sp.]|nr:flagellar hook capping FlgD N-terminal domain-containing protein [Ruminiclostridium sp.]
MSYSSSIGQTTIEEMISSQEASKSKRKVSEELGKDDFLKLLITQLQNQDPMEPMEDQDFIAQIAQFSSLEQMQNLNNSFSYSMGFSLMGKYISAAITDEKTGEVKYVEGEVSSVKSASGEVYLVVDGNDVPVSKITNVSETPLGYQGMEIERYNNLIGLLSSVRTNVSADGTPYSMEGIVAKLQKNQDGIYATLDEVILSVKDIEKNAFSSVEEYIEGMKGQEIVFKAKDEKTDKAIEIKGVLRDGILDEEKGCYHVILDNVEVPVEDIVSTRKVDLVSTEQKLLSEILNAIKTLEEKVPNLSGDLEETGGIPEAGATEETGSTETPGDTETTGESITGGGDA